MNTQPSEQGAKNGRFARLVAALGGNEGAFRAVLLALFVLVFLAWVITSTLLPAKTQDTFRNSYSPSPGGQRAIFEALEVAGYPVRRDAGNPSPRENEALVIIDPFPDEVESLQSQYDALFEKSWDIQATLLALPKRGFVQVEDPNAPPGKVTIDSSGIESLAPLLHRNLTMQGRITVGERASASKLVLRNLGRGKPGMTCDLEPLLENFGAIRVFEIGGRGRGEFDVLVETEAGDPVAITLDSLRGPNGARVVLVSDPTIFTNEAMSRVEGAPSMALALLRATGREAYVFDGTFNGLIEDQGITDLATTPPGIWITLSVFLLMFVFAWNQASVKRPVGGKPLSRRSRAQVIQGAARLFARSRDYRMAERALLYHARAVLPAGDIHVHARGMAVPLSGGLAPDDDMKLAKRQHETVPDDTPDSFIETAQLISSIKRRNRHAG